MQARILVDSIEDCDHYFADCAFYYEIERRPGRSTWYRHVDFECVAALFVTELAEEYREKNVEAAHKRALMTMRVRNVNVLIAPVVTP